MNRFRKSVNPEASNLTVNPEGGGRIMMEDLKQKLKEQAQKVDQLRGYL